jgi:hypothetical protein
MLALATLVAAVAAVHPPAAYVDTGRTRVPLAITSWCWDAHCGAPLGHSPRRVAVARGALVRVELNLAPTDATVTVGGVPAQETLHGREVSFPAIRTGGITAVVHYRRGWVVYSVRLVVR